MVALSDVNNVIVESYSYDVFGAPTIYDANYTEISPSAIGNPYMFTARRADDETALYYYRARYYAFDIGRFLQTDPIGYGDGVNMYAYVGNNPVMLVDPFGFKAYATIAISGGGGFLIVSGEIGDLFVIDTDTGEVSAYTYGGAGVGLGWGGGASIQIGLLDMDDPSDIAGWGLEVNAFAAAGPEGAGASLYGTGPFGNGSTGGSGGYTAGIGAGIGGIITRTKYAGTYDLNNLPEDIQKKLSPYKNLIENKLDIDLGINIDKKKDKKK